VSRESGPGSPIPQPQIANPQFAIFMSLLAQTLAFSATLAGLVVVSRWITRQVQVLGLRLTNDERAAQMTYYLIMLPGIFLHELSHYFMARAVGLRVGEFSLGPRVRDSYSIELGSVTVSRADVFRESLVGLAPFLSGTVVLVLVGTRVFDVGALGRAGSAGALLRALPGIWHVADFWLWAYVVFVVSNAMMPSAADRQPWLLAGIYLAVALGGVYLLVGLPAVSAAVGAWATGVLQVLTLAFVFTLVLDGAVAAAMWIAEAVIVALRTRRSGEP
jgi:hypothetical protein